MQVVCNEEIGKFTGESVRLSGKQGLNLVNSPDGEDFGWKHN